MFPTFFTGDWDITILQSGRNDVRTKRAPYPIILNANTVKVKLYFIKLFFNILLAD